MLDSIVSVSVAVLSNRTVQSVVLVALAAAGGFFAYKKFARAQRRKKYPKDVVILHQLPPGLRAPSASPFVLKLETWLRMAGIKYENEFGYEFGPKGKTPWITLNGQDIGDSQIIIEFLAKKFNVNFSSQHKPEENGIARAFLKMSEESLFWILLLFRFVYNPNTKHSGAPFWLLALFKPTIKGRTKAQGYGLHSQEEVQSIAKSDLNALNDFIGSKKFMLGEKVCDEDAAVFGMLAQFVHHDRTFLNNYIKDNCPNLLRYCETMKQVYWPDWNDRIREKSN